MPTNQISLARWPLQYVNADGVLGLDQSVPPMQIQFQYDLDCNAAAVKVTQVQLMNSSSLQFNQGTLQAKYPMKITGPLVSGNSYLTNAAIVLTDFTTSAELQLSIYWAECQSPQNQRGVPRFAFQGRTVVAFSAQTTYFAQKFVGTGWDPAQVQVSQTTKDQIYQRSNLSDLSQIGAHANCTNCIPMPLGAPHEQWRPYSTMTFPIFPPPKPPPAPASPGGVA